VTAILSDPKSINLSSTSDDFWILSRALKDFVEANGTLPLRGSIPDMFSDSKRYIQLQNIYRDKAAADAEEVFKLVQQHLEAVGRQPVRFFAKICFLYYRRIRVCF
jgi:amyloid beta precursor protein binding protein 1